MSLQSVKFRQMLSIFQEHLNIKKWIDDKPNVIIIDFENQSSVIITCGGVTPQMKKNHLKG